MKTIAVFFGGDSVEHDVSVITGVLTLNSIDKTKYLPIPVYVDNDGTWYTGETLNDLDEYAKLDIKKLKKVTLVAGDSTLYKIKKNSIKPICKIAVAINCMHGERGEDGSLVGFLNMCGIPISSPDILSSAVSMDKAGTKIFLNGLGINYLPYAVLQSEKDIYKVEELGYPVIVKPTKGGSSIGITVAEDEKALKNSLAFALRFGEKAIVEKYLSNYVEINCAVYRDGKGEVLTSECERPVTKNDILTFDDKYKEATHEFPANIPIEISEEIKNISKKVYSSLGFCGIIRIDFLVSGGKIYLNEINSVPGSLAYYLFCSNLKEYTALLTDLIIKCEKDFSAYSTLKRKISSPILYSSGSKGSKRLKN